LAYLVKEYDISTGFIVNIDQTRCVYAMLNNRTWALTGDAQVAVVGKEEQPRRTWLLWTVTWRELR